MATWTTIPDTDLDPDSPWTSVKALAVRDNPIAIAEGAAGAPSVQAAGLATGTAERDWVLARTAAATAGAVGTYVMATIGTLSTVTYSFGDTVAGSALISAGVASKWDDGVGEPLVSNNLTGEAAISKGAALSGTWRCMGISENYNRSTPDQDVRTATLWLRVS